MDRTRAMELLKECLEEIPHLKGLHHDNQEYKLWRKKVINIIKAGLDADDENEFLSGQKMYLDWSWIDRTSEKAEQEHYLESLANYETNLESIIKKYELGLQGQPASTVELKTAEAFLVHEGEPRALSKLTNFLNALGIECLIAERKPSNGRSVEEQVKWTYQPADFAIILATKGKAINKVTGMPYMGMNVADELGRAREVFKNRVILLLQRGVEPHTNISGIVHERFAPQSMDKAFTKIARELTGWGLIRALGQERK